MNVYLGVDVGSVATKLALVSERDELSICPTLCEIAWVSFNSKVGACRSGRCDLWERTKRELVK